MRERITQVAMHLFARQGFAGTSMREIAVAAGVTKAALYHHFPDKEALYASAMRSASAYLNEQIRNATEGVADPVARLRATVRAHLGLFVTERDLIRTLYHNIFMPQDPTGAPAEDLHTHEQPLLEALSDCATAGLLPAEKVEDVFILVMGALEYSGVRWLLDPESEQPNPKLGDRMLALAIPELGRRQAGSGGARGPVRHPGNPERCPHRAAGRHRRKSARLRSSLPRLAGALLVASAALLGRAEAEDLASPRGFVTAIPGESPPLTLEACVESALRSNAALEAERVRLRELSGDVYQAASRGLPTLDLNGNWTRSRDPSFALDETFGGDTEGSPLDTLFGGLDFIPAPEEIPAQTYWRASADVHWEIRPSLVYNAVGAANVGVARQREIIVEAEHRTTEGTMAAYYGVILAAERVRSLEAELAARREFRDIALRRFRLELATALDTLQATVSLANLEPALRRARQELRNSGARLNVLMGRDPDTPVSVLADLSVEADVIDRDAAVALAVERPDIRQNVYLQKVFERNYGAQKAMHFPFLSLDGSYGFVGRELEGLDDDGHDFWRASITLSVPVFDGLLTKGNLREAGAMIERTRYEREELKRQARLEALSLHGDLEAARANLDAAELNMTRAEDAMRFATLRYEGGKADYLTVLNAQAERFAARTNLIEARDEVLISTAALKRALGFSPMMPLSTIGDFAVNSAEKGNG